MKVINPATQEELADLKEDSAQEVEGKHQEALRAQVHWAQASLEERTGVLRAFDTCLDKRLDELALTQTQETGKPISQAKGEIKGTRARLAYFLKEAPAVVAPQTVHQESGLREEITWEPLGVVANISAWNYPYFVGGNVFLPALLLGNAVLYKPSEFATLTGLKIQECFQEAGLPKGLFQTLVGGGATGQALLDQPMDGFFFTGSRPTGLRVAAAAAKHGVPYQMELGGKDPVYICEDMDPKTSAEAVGDGAFYNAGQSCCSVERIYVHEAIHDEFVEALVSFAKGLTLGDPTDPKTYLGPMTRPQHLEFLSAQVQDAQGKGAKVHCGGSPRQGGFFEPTVLTDVNHSMDIMRDESFGPVIGVMKVGSDDEALELMNDTTYGLTAGVYTKDEKRALGLLSHLKAGSAYWNCCDRVSPNLPWTGWRESGLGSTLSHVGMRPFLKPKAWHLKG